MRIRFASSEATRLFHQWIARIKPYRRIVATAKAAIPSALPMEPSLSLVVAFRLTRSTPRPNMSLSRIRISSGPWHHFGLFRQDRNIHVDNLPLVLSQQHRCVPEKRPQRGALCHRGSVFGKVLPNVTQRSSTKQGRPLERGSRTVGIGMPI